MRHAFLRWTAILLIAACSDSSTAANSPYTVTVAAGDGQSDSVGKTLSQPLGVSVVDKSSGYGAPGVTVDWKVTAGGGSVTATSVTDAGGTASATWTLGPTSGAQHVQASVSGGTPVTFTATALSATTGAVFVASVPVAANYGIHDTYVRDGLAFVCAWNSGVLIYDVGNGIKGGSPATPKLVGSVVTTGGEVHNAWWFHNPVTMENKYLFIGQEGPGTIGSTSTGDIHVVDVSNLAAPVEVASFHVDSAGTHNFWMDEASQILYAAYYNGGVVAIDVSGTLSGDISSRLISRIKPGGAGNTYTWGVQLYAGSADSVYAIDMLSGLWQLHSSGGTLTATAGGNNEQSRYSSDLWVKNGYAYTGTWDWYRRSGLAGSLLKVWQLDSAGHPSAVDSILTANVSAVSDVQVSDDGKLLMFSTEGGSNSGFWYYRLTDDPGHPRYVGYYAVPDGIHTASFSSINGRLYAFGAKDPGNPATPALIILDVTSLDQ